MLRNLSSIAILGLALGAWLLDAAPVQSQQPKPGGGPAVAPPRPNGPGPAQPQPRPVVRTVPRNTVERNTVQRNSVYSPSYSYPQYTGTFPMNNWFRPPVYPMMNPYATMNPYAMMNPYMSMYMNPYPWLNYGYPGMGGMGGPGSMSPGVGGPAGLPVAPQFGVGFAN